MTVSPTDSSTSPDAITLPAARTSPLTVAELTADTNAAFRAALDHQTGPLGDDSQILRGPGKKDAQLSREEEARRRSPTLDPTAAASAELVSPGPERAVMAQTKAIESGQAGAGAPRALSGASPSAKPRETSPTAGTPQAVPNPQPPEPAARGQVSASQAPAPAKAAATSPGPETGRAVSSLATARMTAKPANPAGPAQPRIALNAPARSAAPSTGSSNLNLSRIAGPGAKLSESRSGLKLAKSQTPMPRFKLDAGDEKIAAQFGRGLAAALRQKGGTVTMRLQPEALGELKIKMSLDAGKVDAKFEVQTDQARQLLGKTMDTLRSALEARGLDVDRLDVQVANPATVHSPIADSGQNFGGADAGPGWNGGSGSEHPGQGGEGSAWKPPEPTVAEPTDSEGPWMGREPGGALRIRLDALA